MSHKTHQFLADLVLGFGGSIALLIVALPTVKAVFFSVILALVIAFACRSAR